MNELSKYFWRVLSRYDSSLVYANVARKTSESIGYRKGVADAQYNIGIIYWRQDKYSEALENYFKSLRLYEELSNLLGISNVMTGIGAIRSRQGKYGEALEYYFKSLRIKEELGDNDGIAVSLSTIGYVFYLQRKHNEALEYYFKSLKIHEELNNKVSTAVLLNMIGYVFSSQGKHTEALENYSKALHIYEEFRNKEGIAEAIHNIGNVNWSLGKYSIALEYHLKALPMYEELGDKLRIAISLINIGLMYCSQGNFNSAITYSSRAFRLADSLGIREQKRLALKTLSDCYDSLGQYKKALEYHRQYGALKDSLVNAESLEKTAKLREGYEAEKREQQIALLNKEKSLQESELARSATEQKAQMQSIVLLRNEKHVQELTVQQQEAALSEAHLREERNRESLKLSATQSELQRAEIAQRTAELARRNAIQWSLAAILAAALAGALWLGALYRQKNAANKAILQQQALLEDQAVEIHQANMELYQQNEELMALNAEKNEIMGIVSHDLKNPIGAVRTYAELIENQTFTGDEVLSASGHIVQVSERMLDLVKNLLDMNQLESGGLQLNIVSFDISPMVEAAVYQYQAPAEAKQITLHYSQESPENIAAADEQALMQVLDNLVSNAVKYSPHGKQVFVRLVNTDRAVRIEIQDEGPGISPDDMTKLFGKFARLSAQPTGGEHSTGLGLSIVKKMVEAMNGKVWCESEVGKGATFMVELPKAV